MHDPENGRGSARPGSYLVCSLESLWQHPLMALAGCTPVFLQNAGPAGWFMCLKSPSQLNWLHSSMGVFLLSQLNSPNLSHLVLYSLSSGRWLFRRIIRPCIDFPAQLKPSRCPSSRIQVLCRGLLRLGPLDVQMDEKAVRSPIDGSGWVHTSSPAKCCPSSVIHVLRETESAKWLNSGVGSFTSC